MSWIAVDPASHFPIQNLPIGIFSNQHAPQYKRAGVAIGDFVVDMNALQLAGLLDNLGFDTSVFSRPSLNEYMSLTRPYWRATRSRLHDLLSSDSADNRLESNAELRATAIIPMSDVIMHIPAQIGDYTDFYSSREHATNVGIMFRGVDNALQPNWLHLPVGYHGRSSSVVVSGTDVPRPCGQVAIDAADHKKGSSYSPCRLMDFELEMAFFLGGNLNNLGKPLTLAEAEDSIFGVVLMNDWSARDIQAWEYVPLGPFTAKNFCTSISPWIVSLDALEAFRCTPSVGPLQVDPEPLDYLKDSSYAQSSYDVKLDVLLQGESDSNPSVISKSNLKCLYWNFKQQLVHHSVTGCNMRPGDLLGTGTISGSTPDSLGSMLELSWKGSREVNLENASDPNNSKRKFLKDNDTVIMTGYAQGDGYRVGFGDVAGKVLPAGSTLVSTASQSGLQNTLLTPPYRFKLYSYWRSSSSWRVRIALGLKNLAYEYAAVNLQPLVGNTTNQLPEEYARVNAFQQIPSLEITDESSGKVETLTQSMAILEYLEDAFPSPRLLPGDKLQKFRAREIAEIINSGVQPLHNIGVLRQVKSVELVGQSGVGTSMDLAKATVVKGFEAINILIARNTSGAAGLFAAGTTAPSIADICLVPMFYSAERFGVDARSYPDVARVVAMCDNIPAFQAAMASKQPDAPQ